MGLTDRRILITGEGSGIGLALARALTPDNRVAIAGRDESRLDEARASIPSLDAVRLDVTSEEDGALAIGDIERRLGGLDVLINGAGVRMRARSTSPRPIGPPPRRSRSTCSARSG